jgi:hypothetical protein
MDNGGFRFRRPRLDRYREGNDGVASPRLNLINSEISNPVPELKSAYGPRTRDHLKRWQRI